MRCELCGSDPRRILLLPLQRTDGRLYTYACEECAKESSAFCYIHGRIHQGFSDGSTACLFCVEEMVEVRKPYALGIWSNLLKILSPTDKEWLTSAYELGSIVTGDSEEITILRFIVCKALRTRRTPEEVLREMDAGHSVTSILL